ncbi:hypothetical protein [Actinoplanes sp. NPDC023714]|uniref:SWIM zinc finger family protein n=1 Tax=Actinoplanes sp. NPDC023714 TaxID=3154322 RepID=UPI0033F9F595
MTDLPLAFLGMFESLRMGPTFSRGRRDERAGHVRSLTVSSSLVVALVRGPEDPVAFRARIAVRSFGAAEWGRVEKALVTEARYVASLLDGRMPDGIEAIFAEAGLGLLPLSLDEVALDCTCEGWPMPCVHLAATCYALARTFEADPFEVFTWRGRSRDELLMRLRRLRESAAVAAVIGEGGSAGGGSVGGGSVGGGSVGGGYAGSAGAAGGGSAGSAGAAGAGGGRAGGFEGSAGGHGGRADGYAGGGSADGAGGTGGQRPLVDPDDPGAFWGIEATAAGDGAQPATGLAGERAAGLSGVRPDALLDQLDAPHLSHHGKPIVEVLRPAYAALADDS